MTSTRLWLLIIGMGAVTYAIRLSMILLLGRVRLSPPLRRALDFVPPAVFAAIILPELLRADVSSAPPWSNPRLLVGLLAVIVAWRTRSVLLTISVGMAALWGIGWILR